MTFFSRLTTRNAIWLCAGVLVLIASLIELSLAARVMHQAGVLSALVTGALTVVCAVLATSDERKLPPPTAIMQWSVRFLYVLTAVLFAWLLLLATVQLATHSVEATQFPTGCAWSDVASCVRISPESSVNDNGTVAPVFSQQPCDAVIEATRRFVLDARGRLVSLNATTSFLHATFCSSLMGFVSDFFVLCANNATPIAVQCETRLQFDDLAANQARVDAFFQYLREWNATTVANNNNNNETTAAA
jgi:uncharacterized protein (DUF1499 family)